MEKIFLMLFISLTLMFTVTACSVNTATKNAQDSKNNFFNQEKENVFSSPINDPFSWDLNFFN